MTVREMATDLGLTVVGGGEGLDRSPGGGIYCGDLLSIVMGRAPADGVWVTVMANINTIAVAVLCDLACVVIAEGMSVDEQTKRKALAQGVALLWTDRPVYETAKAVDAWRQSHAS